MLRILSVLVLLITQSGFAAGLPLSMADSCASTRQDTQGGTSWLGCKMAVDVPVKSGDIIGFINNHDQELGLPRGADGLVHVETKNGLASHHERYLQEYAGLPIYGAWVSVHTNGSGRVVAAHARTFKESAAKGRAQLIISAAGAESAARNEIDQHDLADSLRHAPNTDMVWYPLDGELVLAWKLTIFSKKPLGDFLTIVDAGDGAVLFQENRIAFATGSGLVFEPNPYQTQGSGTGLSDSSDANSTALTNQTVSRTLYGLDAGTGLIKGEFVDLSTLNSPSLADVDANEPTRVYNYDRDDPRFEQVVVYHAVDSAQRYFHQLGFDDDIGTPNGIRDFPTLANAHWYSADQSFYSTGDDAIHMGDGGVDDAEDADIILHEYGHAVQHNQNAFWGSGHMGAMGEGFGDYLAASFYAGSGNALFQASHVSCVGEWDAVSYSGSTPPCLRRVDGMKIYPGDLVGQVHADGEIWSRALWDMRSLIGATSADTLALEHHFALPAAATMETAALHVLQADCNLNAFANESPIRDAFCDRGILSGSDCTDAPSYCVSTCDGTTVVVTPGMISGHTQSFKSAGELSTNGAVEVSTSADVTFEATTSIQLNPGFTVDPGGIFTVQIGPVGC